MSTKYLGLDDMIKVAVEKAVSKALATAADEPTTQRPTLTASDSDSDSLKDFQLPKKSISSRKRKAATK